MGQSQKGQNQMGQHQMGQPMMGQPMMGSLYNKEHNKDSDYPYRTK